MGQNGSPVLAELQCPGTGRCVGGLQGRAHNASPPGPLGDRTPLPYTRLPVSILPRGSPRGERGDSVVPGP